MKTDLFDVSGCLPELARELAIILLYRHYIFCVFTIHLATFVNFKNMKGVNSS